MNRSARVVPYPSAPSRWRALVALDETDGAREKFTTVYVPGDFPSGDDARRAGQRVAHAWNAGGALPPSAPPVSGCEELLAAVVAFLAAGPDLLTHPIDAAQQWSLLGGLVHAGGRLADAVDRHRASGCQDPRHATEGNHALARWRKTEAMLALSAPTNR